MPRPTVAVLVPIKAFRTAKVRLAAALPATERAALARSMAAGVLAAARGLRTTVVCDDDDVAAWAAEHGASVVSEPGRGLNRAVEIGVEHLAAAGVDRVIVAHADLPLATDLTFLGATDGIVLVPDRRHDGTNVIVVPARSGFRFSYGPGSFARHVQEAERLGLPATVLEDPSLGWDIDVPADLAVRRP